MGNLFFPQLASGALAQFPIRKTRIGRTIKNLLPDGTLIASPDPAAARLRWELAYTALSGTDLSALAAHFSACAGRLHGFTFIDPTDNMLNSSANLQSLLWQVAGEINLAAPSADPFGGNGAFLTTNTSQVTAEISQTVSVPAGYQYCFSLWASSALPSSIQLIRRGPSTQDATTLAVGPQWSHLVSNGRLDDTGDTLAVAIELQPGQQVSLYGPQLEAQVAPSRYLPTLLNGGVYANAHWAVDELLVSADGVDLFSTAFTIETAV